MNDSAREALRFAFDLNKLTELMRPMAVNLHNMGALTIALPHLEIMT